MNHYPQILFEKICNNEQLSSYRELEELLKDFVNEVRAGFLPDMNQLKGMALTRGAYLMDVLRMRNNVVPDYWLLTDTLEKLENKLQQTGEKISFFKNDPAGGNDEAAQKWGLQRGMYLSRLLQLLNYNSL